MALNDTNKNAIAFKKIAGKAHTQQGFAFTEESIASNIQISFSTVFGESVNANPITNGGLTLPYNNDGIVERVKFEVDVIPDTQIGINQSQGYRLKLPATYTASGFLNSEFSGGTYLHTKLGKLQLVPSLYGQLKLDGTTEYDPIVYQTNGTTVIPKFDPISWILDPYNGILFVQNPPTGYDVSAARPAFVEAFLFVGEYLDVRLSGITGTSGNFVEVPTFTGYTATTETRLTGIEDDIIFLSGETSGKQEQLTAGGGINSTNLANNIAALDLSAYTAPTGISITFTGSSSSFIISDQSLSPKGVEYGANYAATYSLRSLVDKAYVDAVASGLSVKDAVIAASTIDIDLTGATFSGSLDGIALANGARVLIKNQTNAAENGIYDYSAGGNTFARSLDADVDGEIKAGSFTSVLSGTTQKNTIWVVSSVDPIVIDTDDIIWSLLALPTVYIGGVGIDVSGNTIHFDGASVAGNHLVWSGNTLNVDLSTQNVGGGSEIFRDKTGDTFNLRTIIGVGSTVSVFESGNTIVVSGATSGSTVIGVAEDGSYADGLFTDFTPSTPIGTPIDRFNEVLKALAPPPAPELDFISTSSSFSNGKLSFGASRNDIGYTDVSSAAGNLAVDINGLYTAAGTRKGLTQAAVTGILNDDVVGNIGGAGIPFEDNAFNNGDVGQIQIEINGVVFETINLASTTAATVGTYLNISVLKFTKFNSGSPFTFFNYRTGTFTVPTGVMDGGFNYVRIRHSGATFNTVTNYNEWVYDSNASAIAAGAGVISGITTSGSKFISGVEYDLGGSVKYNVTLQNVYRNVYNSTASAFSFVNRQNLSDATSIDISGTGTTGVTGAITKTLPPLDQFVSTPEATEININATMTINGTIILGNTGRLGSAINATHPFSVKSLTSGTAGSGTTTGFLVYNVTQADNKESENLTGEVNRLQTRSYLTDTYASINANTYAWSSTEDLITGNTQHNTGLLVFNGELLYPNTSYLTTQYGIGAGDFTSVTNGPANNADYSSASGIRSFYRLFKSNNPSTQSTLTFTINHTGTNGNFLTNGGTGGTASGNNIKFEFLIKRAGGTTHGWANPFASTGNPEGIANTTSTHAAGVTTVSCTLSTTPRVGDTDIVMVKILAASGFSNRISNIAITNI